MKTKPEMSATELKLHQTLGTAQVLAEHACALDVETLQGSIASISIDEEYLCPKNDQWRNSLTCCDARLNVIATLNVQGIPIVTFDDGCIYAQILKS